MPRPVLPLIAALGLLAACSSGPDRATEAAGSTGPGERPPSSTRQASAEAAPPGDVLELLGRYAARTGRSLTFTAETEELLRGLEITVVGEAASAVLLVRPAAE